VGFTAVVSGQSTASFVDPGYMRILAAQNPEMHAQLKLLNSEDELLKPVSLAYAVRPGSEELLEFLNGFIAERVESGAIEEGRNAWFDRIAQQ
jgi:ABC-type amino acid transport substrate-binding protein